MTVKGLQRNEEPQKGMQKNIARRNQSTNQQKKHFSTAENGWNYVIEYLMSKAENVLAAEQKKVECTLTT